MTIPMLVMTSLLVLSTGVILLVAARLVRALRHTVELEQRIARLQEGLNLLTDTTETGFRQVATELERLAAPGGHPVVHQPTPAPAVRPTAARTPSRSPRRALAISALESPMTGAGRGAARAIARIASAIAAVSA